MLNQQLYFLNEENIFQGENYFLDEDTSHHLQKVLRVKVDDDIFLTNGIGIKAKARIEDLATSSSVKILSLEHYIKPKPSIGLFVALLKNTSRWEWMIEKVVELGVTRIIPLQTARCDISSRLKRNRIENIIISACLQSQSLWFPKLHDAIKFNDAISFINKNALTCFAHCDSDKKRINLGEIDINGKDEINIFIGPEGDFEQHEIQTAMDQQWTAISLGTKRLRSETAALYTLSKFV